MNRQVLKTPTTCVAAALFILFTLNFSSADVFAQQASSYAYHQPTEMMVNYGRQALMICNGLFVSNRSLDLIYEQELKLNRMPVLPPLMVTIDEERQAVAVGGGGNSPYPTMRAAYRNGLGCIVMAPDQTFVDIDALPILEMEPPPGDPSTMAWPGGDVIPDVAHANIDTEALEAAGDWAFDREKHGGHVSQITISLVVVYKGHILYERYAPGVDQTTRTRTWSTAKSIAATLVGIAAGQGKLDLDAPLPFTDWGPWRGMPASKDDPRRQITLRNALHMSSGLYPVDNQRCSVIGSCLSYFAGESAVRGALNRGLVREPGTHWDYENYDTILGVYALKTALGDEQTYLEFPRRALFDKIGMRNTLPGVDRFGDYVMSSQVYTNARDLARLGLLYLNRGQWNGEQILPESWVDFSRTPATSTHEQGGFYGGQWWLVPDDRTDIPQDAYSTAGHRGQFTVVVPSYDLVIVRRGLDWLPGQYRFSQWDLTREVLKALPEQPWGEKPGQAAVEGSGE